MNNAPFLF